MNWATCFLAGLKIPVEVNYEGFSIEVQLIF